jgi:hypothetical protein
MTTVDHEALVAMLDRLKLTAIRDQLDNLIDEAGRRELNRTRFPGHLVVLRGHGHGGKLVLAA